jgi:hypothetical protein
MFRIFPPKAAARKKEIHAMLLIVSISDLTSAHGVPSWGSLVFIENQSCCDYYGWNIVMIPVESLFGMTDPEFPDNVFV